MRPLRVLLVTGHSSQHHDWCVSSTTIARRLSQTGRFVVTTECARMSPGGSDHSANWNTHLLDSADVLVLDYEGPEWPAPARSAVADFVDRGGGLVIFHASDNAFPAWPEFQLLCGISGWAGRTESSGPKVRWRGGVQVLDDSPGTARHPARHDFIVTLRNAEHPIMRGLPAHWLHADDELYSQLRGPARNLEVLATACAASAVHPKATDEHEPVLMTIRYGAGRVFHTTLGHVGPADGSRTTAMDCVGFITTLQRGTEWAATGDVTLPVPSDFPTASRTSIRTD